MRVTTERAEKIAQGPPCWSNPATDLAADLLDARNLLREVSTTLSSSHSAISCEARLMILAYISEEV